MVTAINLSTKLFAFRQIKVYNVMSSITVKAFLETELDPQPLKAGFDFKLCVRCSAFKHTSP